jgi:hypothetical protein
VTPDPATGARVQTGNDEPELRAMAEIVRVLEPLNRQERKRVLAWAWSRFVPWTLLDPGPLPSDTGS